MANQDFKSDYYVVMRPQELRELADRIVRGEAEVTTCNYIVESGNITKHIGMMDDRPLLRCEEHTLRIEIKLYGRVQVLMENGELRLIG